MSHVIREWDVWTQGLHENTSYRFGVLRRNDTASELVTDNFSACAQEHHIPPTCLPTSLLAWSSASFARPNPHSTPFSHHSSPYLSRSRPSLVFSVLLFSLFSIVRPSTHASLDPLFFLTPNIHYLTVIYIFLLFNIFQHPSLLLTKNETRISLSLLSPNDIRIHLSSHSFYSTYFLFSNNYIAPFLHPSSTRRLVTLAVIPTTVHDSLPPGHVAPFPTCVLHRREAWCTLSSASLSLVTHVSFLFLPLPRSSAVRVSLSRPRCFLLSPPVIVFSAPVCCRFPSLAIHPHLPPTISPHQPFSFALPTPTTPLRTYANAAAVIGTATRALVLLLVFFPRENVCGSGERTRAATHTKGSFSGPCDMCTHARARARFFPRSSTVPVRCNGNYVKGVVAC